MNEPHWQTENVSVLVTEFFEQDDLGKLALDVGIYLDCPLLVLDDAFRVAAHFCPVGFSDPLFRTTVAQGTIPYEASALLAKSPALREGKADFIKLEESPFRRRFAPLVCTGVRLGCLICIDTDGHLSRISGDVWRQIDRILAKQLFIETSRQDKPFETAEDILMHLLDGGFPSASYFRLQTVGTYLADFHPYAFALIDLTAYRDRYPGTRHLKEEILARFPDSHPFLYRGDVFLFLHGERDAEHFPEPAKEFGLQVMISEPISDLYELPALYRAAYGALKMMAEDPTHGKHTCTVAEVRVPLLLKCLENRNELICPALRALADHDRKKGTAYCKTLYFYLMCSRSLKRTCDALFTHRNTVLYRIGKMREDFGIPLDAPTKHTELLLGVAILLFRDKGPSFFLRELPKETAE